MIRLAPRSLGPVAWRRPVAVAALLALVVLTVLVVGQAAALALTQDDAAYQLSQLRELLDEMRLAMWLPCH
jgi:hypothetical protein